MAVRLPRFRMLALLAGSVVLFLAWSAGRPAPAAAESCNHNVLGTFLFDPGHFRWDIIQSDAEVSDGGYDSDGNGDVNPGTASDRNDSYDDGMDLEIGPSFSSYSNPDAGGCTSEAGGREIVFPADTTTFPGLSLSRKVYVPSSGTPFARWLDIITNTSPAPITTTIRTFTNLGSDSNTEVTATSSGDATADQNDSWAESNEIDSRTDCTTPPFSNNTCDPPLGHLWDQGGTTVKDRADVVDFTSSVGNYNTDYENVTIQPGETLIYMHVEVQRLTVDDASSAAAALDAGPAEVFADMSDTECSQLQNWVCARPTAAAPPETPAPVACGSTAAKPTVRITSNQHRRTYRRGQKGTVRVTATSPNGLKTNPSTRSRRISTSRLGTHRTTATAVDNCGISKTTVFSYRVVKAAQKPARRRAVAGPRFTG